MTIRASSKNYVAIMGHRITTPLVRACRPAAFRVEKRRGQQRAFRLFSVCFV